jgi:hypothetical protein
MGTTYNKYNKLLLEDINFKHNILLPDKNRASDSKRERERECE